MWTRLLLTALLAMAQLSPAGAAITPVERMPCATMTQAETEPHDRGGHDCHQSTQCQCSHACGGIITASAPASSPALPEVQPAVSRSGRSQPPVPERLLRPPIR